MDEPLTSPVLVDQATRYRCPWFLVQLPAYSASVQLTLLDAGGKALAQERVDLGSIPPATRDNLIAWVRARLKALGKIP